MSVPCAAVFENPDGAGYVSRAGREAVNLPDMKKPDAVRTAKPQTDPTRECVMKVELPAITPYPERTQHIRRFPLEPRRQVTSVPPAQMATEHFLGTGGAARGIGLSHYPEKWQCRRNQNIG
jgi:hypothetical protein